MSERTPRSAADVLAQDGGRRRGRCHWEQRLVVDEHIGQSSGVGRRQAELEARCLQAREGELRADAERLVGGAHRHWLLPLRIGRQVWVPTAGPEPRPARWLPPLGPCRRRLQTGGGGGGDPWRRARGQADDGVELSLNGLSALLPLQVSLERARRLSCGEGAAAERLAVLWKPVLHRRSRRFEELHARPAAYADGVPLDGRVERRGVGEDGAKRPLPHATCNGERPAARSAGWWAERDSRHAGPCRCGWVAWRVGVKLDAREAELSARAAHRLQYVDDDVDGGEWREADVGIVPPLGGPHGVGHPATGRDGDGLVASLPPPLAEAADVRRAAQRVARRIGKRREAAGSVARHHKKLVRRIGNAHAVVERHAQLRRIRLDARRSRLGRHDRQPSPERAHRPRHRKPRVDSAIPAQVGLPRGGAQAWTRWFDQQGEAKLVVGAAAGVPSAIGGELARVGDGRIPAHG